MTAVTEGVPAPGARHVFNFLGAVVFLTAIGNLGLVSVMPTIGRLIGIPDYLVASIFSLSALTWAISSPFWTRRVAVGGSARYVRMGLIGFFVSMAGCGGAVALGIAGLITPFVCFVGFVILRAAFGLFGSASAIATQTLIAHSTEGQQRTRILTGIAGALSLGTIVGPAVAPLAIVPPLGLTGPMVLFATLALLAYAGTFIYLPKNQLSPADAVKQRAPAPSILSVWRTERCGPALTFGLLLCSGQAINLYTIGFVLLDRAPGDPLLAQAQISLTMVAGACSALVAQWGLPRVAKIMPVQMMLLGVSFSLAGNLIPFAGGGQMVASAGFVLACFGYGLARPGFSAAASLAGSKDEQVAIASATSFIAGASIAVPPVLAAIAYQQWWGAPFGLTILLLVLGTGALAPRGIVFRKR